MPNANKMLRAEDLVRERQEFITIEQLAAESGINTGELEDMIAHKYLHPLVSDINPDIRIFPKQAVLSSINDIKALWDDYKAELTPYLNQHKIKFVDNITKKVLKEVESDGLHLLREDDFPTPYQHDGKKFTGWSQGTDKDGNTLFTAQYTNLTKEEIEAGATDPLFDEDGELVDDDGEDLELEEFADTPIDESESEPAPEFEKFDFDASFNEILEKEMEKRARANERKAIQAARRKYFKHQAKCIERNWGLQNEALAAATAAARRNNEETLKRLEAQRELYERKQLKSNAEYENNVRTFFAEQQAKRQARADADRARRDRYRKEQYDTIPKPSETSKITLSNEEYNKVRDAINELPASAKKTELISRLDDAHNSGAPLTVGQVDNIINGVKTDESRESARRDTEARVRMDETSRSYHDKYTAEMEAEGDRTKYGVDYYRERERNQRLVSSDELATLQGSLNGLPETPEITYIRNSLSQAAQSENITAEQVKGFVDKAYEDERRRLEEYQRSLENSQANAYKAMADAISADNRTSGDTGASSMASVLQSVAHTNNLRDAEYIAEARRYELGVDALRHIQESTRDAIPSAQVHISELINEASKPDARPVTLLQVTEVINKAYEAESNRARDDYNSRIEATRSEIASRLDNNAEWNRASQQYNSNADAYHKHISNMAEQYRQSGGDSDIYNRLTALAAHVERDVSGSFTPSSAENARVVYEQVKHIYDTMPEPMRKTLASSYQSATELSDAMYKTVESRYSEPARTESYRQADAARTYYSSGSYSHPPEPPKPTANKGEHHTSSPVGDSAFKIVHGVLSANPEYVAARQQDAHYNAQQYSNGAKAYSAQLNELAKEYEKTKNYNPDRAIQITAMAAVVAAASKSYSPEAAAAIAEVRNRVDALYKSMPPNMQNALKSTVEASQVAGKVASDAASRSFAVQEIVSAQAKVSEAYSAVIQNASIRPVGEALRPTPTSSPEHKPSTGNPLREPRSDTHTPSAPQQGKPSISVGIPQHGDATRIGDTPQSAAPTQGQKPDAHSHGDNKSRAEMSPTKDGVAHGQIPNATAMHGDNKSRADIPQTKDGVAQGQKPSTTAMHGDSKSRADASTTKDGVAQGKSNTPTNGKNAPPSDAKGRTDNSTKGVNDRQSGATAKVTVAGSVAGGVTQMKGSVNAALKPASKAPNQTIKQPPAPIASSRSSATPKPADTASAHKLANVQKQAHRRAIKQAAGTKQPKPSPPPKCVLNPKNISAKRPAQMHRLAMRMTSRQKRIVQMALAQGQRQAFFTREWKQNTRTQLTQLRRATFGTVWRSAKNALRRAFYSGSLGKTPPMRGAMQIVQYAQWTMPMVNSMRISASKMGVEKLARKLEARLAKDGTNLKALLKGAGLKGDFSKLDITKRKDLNNVVKQLRGEMRNNPAFRATFANKGTGALKRTTKNPLKKKKGVKTFKFNAKEVSAAKAMLTLQRMQKAQAKIRKARMKSRFSKIGLARHLFAGTAAAQGLQMITRNVRYASTAMKAIKTSLKAVKLAGKLAFMPLRIFRNTKLGKGLTAAKNKLSQYSYGNLKKAARKRAKEAAKKGTKRAASAISKLADRNPVTAAIKKRMKKTAKKVSDKAKKFTARASRLLTKAMSPVKAVAKAFRAIKAFVYKLLLVVAYVALGLIVVSYIANTGSGVINVMFGWLLGPDNTGQEEVPLENTLFYDMWNQIAAKEESWLNSIESLKSATPSGDEAVGFYDPNTGQPYQLQEWGYALFNADGTPMVDSEGEQISSAGVIVKYENGEGQQIPYRMNARDILAITSARFQGDFAAQIDWMHDYAWRGNPEKFLFFVVSHDKANLWEVSHSSMDEIQKIVGPRNPDGTLAPPIICPGCAHYTYHCDNADEIARITELYNSSVRTDENGNTVSAIVETEFTVPTLHEHGCAEPCQPRHTYRCTDIRLCTHAQNVTYEVNGVSYQTSICPGHIGVYDETGANFTECTNIAWEATTENLNVTHYDTELGQIVVINIPITYNKPVCNGHCDGHDVHYCHGHRTLTLVAQILTMDECVEDETTGLFHGTSFFDADPHCEPRHSAEYPAEVEQPNDPTVPHSPDESPNPNAEGQAWAISYWDRDHIALAVEYFHQDWFANYGVLVTSEFGGGNFATGETMSPAEIADILNGIHTTDFRMQLITHGLNSVGRIPYFYGGKAVKTGYTDRPILISGVRYEIGEPTHVADKNGRTLAGLDCSGWTCWLYNTVIDNLGISPSSVLVPGVSQNLGNMGTAGLKDIGVGIMARDLQPGDLCVVRSNSRNHIGIFLTWTNYAAGEMLCVHEGPPNVNVKKFNTTSWTHFRRVINQEHTNP